MQRGESGEKVRAHYLVGAFQEIQRRPTVPHGECVEGGRDTQQRHLVIPVQQGVYVYIRVAVRPRQCSRQILSEKRRQLKEI